VLAVQNNGIRETITINAQGVSGLTLTPDHKLWTRIVRKIAWAQGHSRQDAMNANPCWIAAEDTVGSYVNCKLPPIEQCKVDNTLHWWIVGRWLADGHLHHARDAVMISCGKHELHDLIIQLGEHKGFVCDTGSAMQIRIKDKKAKIRDILKDCGNGAFEKHLPSVAYTLPIKLAKAILDGYLSGDGHYIKSRNRWCASSISKELLLGMSMLAQRVYGAISSIYPGRPAGKSIIQGRIVNVKQDWIFSFDVPDKNRQKGLPFILDDGSWKKVRSINNAKNIETWNIRVKDDESFSAEGCIVKNCPLQLDTIARCLELWSNPGDTVISPFAGVGSEGYEAIQRKRNFIGIELKESYFNQMVKNLEIYDKSYKQTEIFA